MNLKAAFTKTKDTISMVNLACILALSTYQMYVLGCDLKDYAGEKIDQFEEELKTEATAR